MPTFTLLQKKSYNDGVQSAQQAVPVNLAAVFLSIDTAAMTDPASAFDVLLDISLDGGLTFASQFPDGQVPPAFGVFPVRSHHPGGTYLDKFGNALPFNIRCALPDVGNANRVARASLTITGGPVTLGATVTV